jgi:hypothetical protein
MKILIKITKDILLKSSQCSEKVGFNCAVSLAIREIFPKAWIMTNYILVNERELVTCYANIVDYFNSEELKIKLPKEATNFINSFDLKSEEERIEMNPISFEIDVPNEVIEEIGINEIYKILSESKTLELVNI